MAAKRRQQEPWHDDARHAVRVLRRVASCSTPQTRFGVGMRRHQRRRGQAVERLEIKAPRAPRAVLVADDGHVEELVSDVPEAWDLMAHADRPTTIVFPDGRGVSEALMGRDGSLAIRCIRDPYCAYVIRGLGRPIASTSANVTGGPTPKGFRDVPDVLRQGVDHVSKHRQEEAQGRASLP